MPRTPFQFWCICGTWPDRRAALGPMLPTGQVTGNGPMAGRLMMTLPAVLISCLVIYIFWTPYKAPGWQTICRRHQHEASCHPCLQTLETNFFHAKIRCWLWLHAGLVCIIMCHTWRTARITVLATDRLLPYFISNSFLIRSTVQLPNLILSPSFI